MGLLVLDEKLKKGLLRSAITKVFEHRATHPVPTGFVEPPASWVPVFTRLRVETGLNKNTDETVALIANGLCLPIFVREEKARSSPKQTPCHFCGTEALGWLSKLNGSGGVNETEETYDYDCPKCHSYRVTGLFIELTKSENNLSYRDTWKIFLQKRTKEEGKRRILISSLTMMPND